VTTGQVGAESEIHMRIAALLALAAVILAVIIQVAPSTTVYDEASVYNIDFQLPVQVAAR
jgi:hypothetical protein